MNNEPGLDRPCDPHATPAYRGMLLKRLGDRINDRDRLQRQLQSIEAEIINLTAAIDRKEAS
jgi:hypothetical protein